MASPAWLATQDCVQALLTAVGDTAIPDHIKELIRNLDINFAQLRGEEVTRLQQQGHPASPGTEQTSQSHESPPVSPRHLLSPSPVASAALLRRDSTNNSLSFSMESGDFTPTYSAAATAAVSEGEQDAVSLSAALRQQRLVTVGLRLKHLTSTLKQRAANRGPTGTIVLAFTDVQGSTNLWESVPTATMAAIDLHNGMIRSLIEQYHGFEVKTEGDAFMVAFGEAINAVKWALDVQTGLLALDWPAALLEREDACVVQDRHGQITFRGLRVRIGLSLGTPEARTDPISGRTDYFGPAVNLAARIGSEAKGGEVLIGSALYLELVRLGAFVAPGEAFATGAGVCDPGCTHVKFEGTSFASLPESAGAGDTAAQVGDSVRHGSLCGQCLLFRSSDVRLKGISTPEQLRRLLPASLGARSFEHRKPTTRMDDRIRAVWALSPSSAPSAVPISASEAASMNTGTKLRLLLLESQEEVGALRRFIGHPSLWKGAAPVRHTGCLGAKRKGPLRGAVDATTVTAAKSLLGGQAHASAVQLARCADAADGIEGSVLDPSSFASGSVVAWLREMHRTVALFGRLIISLLDPSCVGNPTKGAARSPRAGRRASVESDGSNGDGPNMDDIAAVLNSFAALFLHCDEAKATSQLEAMISKSLWGVSAEFKATDDILSSLGTSEIPLNSEVPHECWASLMVASVSGILATSFVTVARRILSERGAPVGSSLAVEVGSMRPRRASVAVSNTSLTLGIPLTVSHSPISSPNAMSKRTLDKSQSQSPRWRPPPSPRDKANINTPLPSIGSAVQISVDGPAPSPGTTSRSPGQGNSTSSGLFDDLPNSRPRRMSVVCMNDKSLDIQPSHSMRESTHSVDIPPRVVQVKPVQRK